MVSSLCLIGLDRPEYEDIRNRIGEHALAFETIPRIAVKDGKLFVESLSGSTEFFVSKVLFHGIFEDDFDLLTGLALWGGKCLPDARAMMDCRLKIPCLVRALSYSKFSLPQRGFASQGIQYDSETQRVAKWGNWHCGENKELFQGSWVAEHSCVIEPFMAGDAVRVVMIGEQFFQIRLAGSDWKKSIHDDRAEFMPLDSELLEDTKHIAVGFGLGILANDYIVSSSGEKHLLEVNHCPNVTRFREVWEAYADYVSHWLMA